MAFSTGFQSVQRHNIRNLYSTNVSIEHRTMKRKMESQRKISRNNKYVSVSTNSDRITYEYFPEYKAYIPKAPAFRIVSARKAREISDRLSMSRQRTFSFPTKEEEKEPEENSLRRETSSIEIQQNSVERLNQPTVASYIRLKMSAGKKKPLHVSEITNACDRLHLQPSQRYFPSAYKNWLHVNEAKSMRTSFITNYSNRNSYSSGLEY